MYEHVPVQRIVDNIRHIYDLYRHGPPSLGDSVDDQAARMQFLRGLVNNLRNERSRPSPRVLMELTRRVPLATGGVFRLVGYRLEKMRELDFLLNGHRTRIVESYPFYRDREIDLPGTLSEQAAFERSAFVSELVLRWQRQVPIRVLHFTGLETRRYIPRADRSGKESGVVGYASRLGCIGRAHLVGGTGGSRRRRYVLSTVWERI